MSSATPQISEGLDMSINPLARFDDLITEAEICKRYVHLLSERELRQARRNKSIDHVTGKKGMIQYRPVWIAQYLDRKVTKCQPQQVGSGIRGLLDRARRQLRLSLRLLVGSARKANTSSKS